MSIKKRLVNILNEIQSHGMKMENKNHKILGKYLRAERKNNEDVAGHLLKNNVEPVVKCCNCEYESECNKEIYLEGGYIKINSCSYGTPKKKEVNKI